LTEIRKKIILSQEEINGVSSVYLNEGRKLEDWEITYVEIGEKILTARVRMRSPFPFPTTVSPPNWVNYECLLYTGSGRSYGFNR